MTRYASNIEFMRALRQLIDRWCDRHCLKALVYILPDFFAFNGLTDGWGELRGALVRVRGQAREELTDEELEIVADMIAAVDHAIGERPLR